MNNSSIVSDFFVSSSLHESADSDYYVTIASTPEVITFVDSTDGRKFRLNSLTIENSDAGEIRFTINDDNAVYWIGASTTESIDYLGINKITFLTTGRIRWKALANTFYDV